MQPPDKTISGSPAAIPVAPAPDRAIGTGQVHAPFGTVTRGRVHHFRKTAPSSSRSREPARRRQVLPVEQLEGELLAPTPAPSAAGWSMPRRDDEGMLNCRAARRAPAGRPESVDVAGPPATAWREGICDIGVEEDGGNARA
jgi:hypothetical protein